MIRERHTGNAGGAVFSRNVGVGDPGRAGSRDLHGDFLHQLLEVISASDEVRLAVDLDHRANATAVDVGFDQALTCVATGLLAGFGSALLAQDRRCLFEVAAGCVQRALALHNACAGALTKLLDECS